MEQYPKKLPPQVDSRLRHSILEMPVEIRKASGIVTVSYTHLTLPTTSRV